MAKTSGNPIRGRFNAAFFDRMENYMHKIYGPIKQEMFGELPKEVVELGPGAGANLRYYSKGTKLLAIEPNPMMHQRLARNAQQHGVALDIRAIQGEHLDLEDASAEVVVSTLVLCTVQSQQKALAEIHRVLKPGGRFVFLEHVAAPKGSLLRPVQHTLHRPWRWLFEGCNLTRDTALAIESAGFSEVKIERFTLRSLFYPVTPHITGAAVK